MTSFYDEKDLELAVKYASEYAEKYTENEVYDILSELNFTPDVCQKALAKLEETEKSLPPDIQTDKGSSGILDLDKYVFSTKIFYSSVWYPFRIYVYLFGIFASFLVALCMKVVHVSSVLLEGLYGVLTPVYLVGIIFAEEKLETFLKLSASLALIFISLRGIEFASSEYSLGILRDVLEVARNRG